MNINFMICAIKALVIVTAFHSGSMWLSEGKGDKCKTWIGISQIVSGVALLIITILYYSNKKEIQMNTIIKIIALILATILLMISSANDARHTYHDKHNSTTGWAILIWISHLVLMFV